MSLLQGILGINDGPLSSFGHDTEPIGQWLACAATQCTIDYEKLPLGRIQFAAQEFNYHIGKHMHVHAHMYNTHTAMLELVPKKTQVFALNGAAWMGMHATVIAVAC